VCGVIGLLTPCESNNIISLEPDEPNNCLLLLLFRLIRGADDGGILSFNPSSSSSVSE
jgi:hypothetical protein